MEWVALVLCALFFLFLKALVVDDSFLPYILPCSLYEWQVLVSLCTGKDKTLLFLRGSSIGMTTRGPGGGGGGGKDSVAGKSYVRRCFTRHPVAYKPPLLPSRAPEADGWMAAWLEGGGRRAASARGRGAGW